MFTKSPPKMPNNPPQTSAARPAAASAAQSKPVPLSLLAANFKLSGDLDNDGDLQIDGSIEGNVKSQSLTVGESGHVVGSIESEDTTISGTVSGNINTKRLNILASAQIEGDIFYEALQVVEGAKINGKVSYRQFKSQSNHNNTASAQADSNAGVSKDPVKPTSK
ncbi:MAG: polymer-forming cytoskeletal protein [Alphaproteobacteria bacterium]